MKHILLEVKEQLATITISREEALNALNFEMLDEFNAILNKLNSSDVKCLIINSSCNKTFVAGADIEEMINFNMNEAKAFSQKGNMVFRKIEKLPFPTIAEVKGYALGGG